MEGKDEDVRVFRDKGVDEGKERRGKLKREMVKKFSWVCLHQKLKRVILKNKFEKGIFTFKDF